MRAAIGGILLWAVALAASAQAPEPRSQRVLFIGNSLTTSGDIPERFGKLASAMGRTAVVGTLAPGDFSLDDHWRDGRAVAEIRKGWDVVVLQQGPSADAGEREQLLDASRRFARAIREAGARPAHFMTWPAAERLRDFAGVIAAYRAAAFATDSMLIPVGEAWLRALSADKRLRLHGDSRHAGSLGSDLAVLTLYLAIFPAGHQEFDEAFVTRAAKALEMPRERRDLLFDAATRAIDEPMALK